MADLEEIVTTLDNEQGWEGRAKLEEKDFGSAEDQGLMPEQQQGSKNN